MTVTMYTKPGCHLCEKVEEVIFAVRQRVAFEYIKQNIQDDPELEKRYGALIPVVTVDGREIARYRLRPGQLEAALAQS